jgi:hypothetical protein
MPSKKTTMIREESSVDEENTPGAKIAVLRNEVRHVNETLNRVETKIDNMALSFITTSQFVSSEDASKLFSREIDARVVKLENFVDTIKSRIAMAAVVMLVLMVLGFYGLEKYFRG